MSNGIKWLSDGILGNLHTISSCLQVPSRAQQTAHSQQTVAQGAFKVCGKLHTVNERNFYIVRLSSHARLEAFAIQPNTILQTAHSQHNSDTGWLQSVRQTTHSQHNSGTGWLQSVQQTTQSANGGNLCAQGACNKTQSANNGTGCLQSVHATSHSQHNSGTGWLQSVRQTTQSENSGNRCAQDDCMCVTKDRQQTVAQGAFKVCMQLHTVSTTVAQGAFKVCSKKLHTVSKWWRPLCIGLANGVQQNGAYMVCNKRVRTLVKYMVCEKLHKLSVFLYAHNKCRAMYSKTFSV